VGGASRPAFPAAFRRSFHTSAKIFHNQARIIALVFSVNVVLPLFSFVSALSRQPLAFSVNARGASVSFARDAEGCVLSRTAASGTDRFAYNAAGLRVSATDGAGVATLTGCDGLYRPVATRDALAGQWRTGYELLDRPVATADPSTMAWGA
jgi:YD repeat-containing protein